MEKRTQRSNNKEEEKKKKKGGLWIKILAVILIGLGVLFVLNQCGYLRFPWQNDRTLVVSGDLFPGSMAEDGALPKLTDEELLAQMQRVADASQFSYKINARPEFATGSAAGNWEIENPNYNVYPIVVQVTLDSTGEMIFDSGGLLPNQHIETAKMTKALKAGTYPATATINMYDPETNKAVGKTQAGLVITVLE